VSKKSRKPKVPFPNGAIVIVLNIPQSQISGIRAFGTIIDKKMKPTKPTFLVTSTKSDWHYKIIWSDNFYSEGDDGYGYPHSQVKQWKADYDEWSRNKQNEEGEQK